MGKSTSQPDLLDVKNYLEATDALHKVSTHLELRPDVTTASAVWLLRLVSVWPDLAVSGGQGNVITSREFSGGDMSALGAVLYGLCWSHDVELGKVRWRQMTLPSA